MPNHIHNIFIINERAQASGAPTTFLSVFFYFIRVNSWLIFIRCFIFKGKKMDHTFLFQEGLWTIEGSFFDEGGSKIPLEGKLRITHTEKIWVIEKDITLLEGNKAQLSNRYEIIPFGDYSEVTTWRSFSSKDQTLSGSFTIIDDTIISLFVSEKGNDMGTEFFLKLSSLVYKSRGALFQGNLKCSSWAVTLYKFE